MNFNKMKCFVDAVKYKSFTKAAKANYISQTAISQQIASMEEELGIKLFERTKKGLLVTEAGRSFYESSLHILSVYARSVSVAKCVDQGLSGNIVLGISPEFDLNSINHVIGKLCRSYPDVRIMLRTASPAELSHMFKEAELAMVITLPYDFNVISIQGAVAEPLISCGYELLVSVDNPLASLEQVRVNDIRNEKFVVPGEIVGKQTYGHVVVEHMQNIHGIMPSLFVPNFESLKMMVATNQGVAILPKCNNLTECTAIKKLPLLDYPETVTYSYIWRPKFSSPGLFHLVDILKDYFDILKKNENGR